MGEGEELTVPGFFDYFCKRSHVTTSTFYDATCREAIQKKEIFRIEHYLYTLGEQISFSNSFVAVY